MLRLRVRADCRDESVTPPRHVRDVGGMLWIVRKRAAQDPNGLVNGILGNNEVLPDRVKQLIDADDFAGLLGQADQETHRARLELDGCTFARNFIESRIDSPLPDTKR